ncbi:MAG TPA: MotA/TolQ/ExbB proton channel family protein [Stellaceae bacterium]|nr:MotA/TolQ/ExbB proton channel family protein [Stellaceae bacterium]
MTGAAASLSIVDLFFHADVIVKSVLVLLLLASIWSWAVIIEKAWQLSLARRAAVAYEERAAAARTAAELLARPSPEEAASTAGLVIAAGVAEGGADASAVPETLNERRERIERAMRLALNAELRRLELRLPFLATLGSAAPFIGLFGTVWGIMRSFGAIAAANNTSLAVVAPGIAEALFATAMGLAAAIPAVVAYNKITVDLGRFAGRMQALIGRSGVLLARAAGEA